MISPRYEFSRPGTGQDSGKVFPRRPPWAYHAPKANYGGNAPNEMTAHVEDLSSMGGKRFVYLGQERIRP